MRLQALDGWRGIACIYVALYHLNVAHSVWNARWIVHPEPVLELFFVLSGFVMAMGFADAVNDARGFVAYLIRRLGRILPLHLVTLSMLFVLVAIKILAGANHGGFSWLMRPEAILPQIFGVQTWVGMGLSWNYPSWTMSAEMAAYIVLGVMVWLIRPRLLRLIAAAALVLGAATLFHGDLTAPGADYNIVTVSRCFTAFFFGFIIYDLWRDRPLPSPAVATVLQVLAIAAVVAALTVHFVSSAYFVNHLIAALVIFAFANDRGPLARIMAAKPLLWFGKLSFSLYMVHAVVMLYFETAFDALGRIMDRDFAFIYLTPHGSQRELISLGPVWANNLLGLAYMAVVIVAAMLLYRWVEDPTRRISTDIAKRYQRREFELSLPLPSAWGKRRTDLAD